MSCPWLKSFTDRGMKAQLRVNEASESFPGIDQKVGHLDNYEVSTESSICLEHKEK